MKTKNVYFFTVAHFWPVFYKNNVKLWWTFQVIFHLSHSWWRKCHLVFENRMIFCFTAAKKLKFFILPILWSLYCQFSPFDFDRPSWPQFCLEVGKIFSGMLELDKILDWNLIWIFFVRNFFHSEPRKIGLKMKNVYFLTVGAFFTKIMLSYDGLLKSYFISHIPSEKFATLFLKIGPYLDSQRPKNWNF